MTYRQPDEPQDDDGALLDDAHTAPAPSLPERLHRLWCYVRRLHRFRLVSLQAVAVVQEQHPSGAIGYYLFNVHVRCPLCGQEDAYTTRFPRGVLTHSMSVSHPFYTLRTVARLFHPAYPQLAVLIPGEDRVGSATLRWLSEQGRRP